MNLYIIAIYRGVDIEAFGPFSTERQRIVKAQQLEDSGWDIFRLNSDARNQEVGVFAFKELNDSL